MVDLTWPIIIAMGVTLRIWFWLGGWPEAYYRIFRKDYFCPYIREPTGAIKRWVLRTNRLQSHSPATFALDWKTGKAEIAEYLTDPDLQSRTNGRPAWYYTYDDCRPIPFDPGDSRCDPINVHKAIKNKVANDIHREGEKKRKRGGIWLVLIVVSIIGLIGYYSWYLHDLQCKAGHC